MKSLLTLKEIQGFYAWGYFYLHEMLELQQPYEGHGKHWFKRTGSPPYCHLQTGEHIPDVSNGTEPPHKPTQDFPGVRWEMQW